MNIPEKIVCPNCQNFNDINNEVCSVCGEDLYFERGRD